MARVNIPPVLSVNIEDSMDIMIARDTARRAASLLGFNISCKAQLSAAVAALAEHILKAGSEGVIHLNGVQNGSKIGIQVSCDAEWLKGMPQSAADALHSQFSKMVDEVDILELDPPQIVMVFWLLPPRQAKDE